MYVCLHDLVSLSLLSELCVHCAMVPGNDISAAEYASLFTVWLLPPLILDNEIGPKGAKALAPALQRLTQMKTLDLSGL